MQLALIGHGAIAHQIRSYVEAPGCPHTITGVLDIVDSTEPGSPTIVRELRDLLAERPDLVVECAGHSAVDTHAVPILEAGYTLLIVSIGALADDVLRKKIFSAAEQGLGRLLLPAGAIGGIDALAAAKFGGLDRVTLRSSKPPLAWGGAPGVEGVDLAAINKPTTLFAGSAGRAAQLFPKNANVAATVALAGLGFEETQVELVADPAAERNVHALEAEGQFGRLEIVLENLPSTDNPKTSALTAMSLFRLIENQQARIVI